MRIYDKPLAFVPKPADGIKEKPAPTKSDDAPASSVVHLRAQDSAQRLDGAITKRLDELRTQLSENNYVVDYAKLAERIVASDLGD